jgi:hypothetical protein
VRTLKARQEKGDGRYRLGFVIRQAMAPQPLVEGEMRVRLKGVSETGGEQVLDLADLVQGEFKTAMRFKQFQKVGWSFRLPEGFQPDRWLFELKPASDKIKPYRDSFPWRVVE